MSRRGPFALCFLLLGSCQWTSPTSVPAVPDAGLPPVASVPAAAPVPEPLPPCRARGSSPLSAALDYLDSGKYPEALSCAAQASALERAQALMSIQAIKGVEVGDGFETTRRRGSVAHDELLVGDDGVHRETGRAGGAVG